MRDPDVWKAIAADVVENLQEATPQQRAEAVAIARREYLMNNGSPIDRARATAYFRKLDSIAERGY